MRPALQFQTVPLPAPQRPSRQHEGSRCPRGRGQAGGSPVSGEWTPLLIGSRSLRGPCVPGIPSWASASPAVGGTREAGTAALRVAVSSRGRCPGAAWSSWQRSSREALCSGLGATLGAKPWGPSLCRVILTRHLACRFPDNRMGWWETSRLCSPPGHVHLWWPLSPSFLGARWSWASSSLSDPVGSTATLTLTLTNKGNGPEVPGVSQVPGVPGL